MSDYRTWCGYCRLYAKHYVKHCRTKRHKRNSLKNLTVLAPHYSRSNGQSRGKYTKLVVEE